MLWKTTVCKKALHGFGSYKFDGRLNVVPVAIMCQRGYHAVDKVHRFMWPGTELWEAELTNGEEKLLRGSRGKFCGRELRFMKRDKRWNKTKLQKFARAVLKVTDEDDVCYDELKRDVAALKRKSPYLSTEPLYRGLCEALGGLCRNCQKRTRPVLRKLFERILER